MTTQSERYIPALSHAWLTPLYDPLLKWGMREEKFKRALIAQANIQPGQRVLDVGCGTGALTILVKQMHPDAEVVGLDGDPQVLDIARAKAAKARVEITFDEGMAYQLPYPDNSFDRVLSSLVFHHLTTENKRRALGEVYRVLRPGGELHLADLGKPRNLYTYLVSQIMLRLERAAENIQGLLPEMMHDAGFEQVEETARFTIFFGTLALIRARKS